MMDYTVEVRTPGGEVAYSWTGYADNEYAALLAAANAYEDEYERRQESGE